MENKWENGDTKNVVTELLITELKMPKVVLTQDLEKVHQGVSYSQKLCSKSSFPSLVKNRTSQFVFRKYWTEYKNVKIASKINS